MSSSPSSGKCVVGSCKKVTIAVAQLCSTSSKLSNLVDVAKCCGWAKRAGCSMVFLPECFGFMGESGEESLKRAEPPLETVVTTNRPSLSRLLRDTVAASAAGSCKEGDEETTPSNVPDDTPGEISILDGLKTIARESNQWISCGGMHVGGAPPASVADEGEPSDRPRMYNTHIILDNSGTLQAAYRKIHLFDVSIPGKVTLRESTRTAPGTELAVCDSPIGRLGLSTCYDVRFPEMYVELVQQLGAEVLLVPSAFTVPTGTAHWHVLLKARAIENQCFVIAAAQYGKHNALRESYGHSLVVDPWGTVLADAGGVDGPGTTTTSVTVSGDVLVTTPSIVTADIDLESLVSVRQRMPVQSHRENSKLAKSDPSGRLP